MRDVTTIGTEILAHERAEVVAKRGQQKEISIIIYASHATMGLRHLLESIEQQEGVAVQTLLMTPLDHGALRKLLRPFSREVQLNWHQLHQEDCARAFNYGARYAQGDYLLFLTDQDRLMGHQALKSLWEATFAPQGLRYRVVHGLSYRRALEEPRGTLSGFDLLLAASKQGLLRGGGGGQESLQGIKSLSAPPLEATLISKELFELAGPFEPRYGERYFSQAFWHKQFGRYGVASTQEAYREHQIGAQQMGLLERAVTERILPLPKVRSGALISSLLSWGRYLYLLCRYEGLYAALRFALQKSLFLAHSFFISRAQALE